MIVIRSRLRLGLALLLGGVASSWAATAPPAPHKPAPRARFTKTEREAATVPGFPSVRFFGDDANAYRAALPDKPGPWLALSAGGEDGAFGAGFLFGLDQSGKRPPYSVITGVSTGSLIATYAFAGSRYDRDLKSAYTGVTSADVFEVGRTPDSLVDVWPFRKLIAKRVTPELLRAVAAQYRRGRRLFVVTTDLDAGRPVVWNMGAIAKHGGARALALFRRVLIASSSIPGMFPPVVIKTASNGKPIEELYADGGVSAPFYLAPESVLAQAHGAVPTTSIQIVINAKLGPDFWFTKRNTLAVLGRALGLGLSAGARFEIANVRRWATRARVPVSIAAINAGFKARSHGAFDPKYMKALFTVGEKDARKSAASAPQLTR